MTQLNCYTSFESDLKNYWIDSLNHDNNYEFLLFIRLVTPFKQTQKVTIKDIFHEGFLVNISHKTDQRSTPYFYNFPKYQTSPLNYFINLYNEFLAKQGNTSISYTRRFIVKEKYTLSPSFTRIKLQSLDGLHFNIQPAFFAAISINDNIFRAYTYRQINYFNQSISIDFFNHGVTPTSEWLKHQEKGSIITTIREKNESITHLDTGIVLLCGDETAFPAIAEILNNWMNIRPPLVLLEMRNEADLNYFNDCETPPGTKIHTFTITNEEEYGTQIKHFLERKPLIIEKVWGAFNRSGMKLLRQFFEQKYHLTSSNMIIRAYWNNQRK
ncbi:siderophore-interacting protein [Pelistega sp. MC2]|uniref:siderophore-interacting protein n=1 Tax=Pelistega sp. MC2 TaxID=1720297 RepID=UPI0008D8FB0D|nr:SIP domain-containing protein [Pelistega sp. MC2]